MAPRETENNAYAKFRGDKQRTLWCVMVFLEWSIQRVRAVPFFLQIARFDIFYVCFLYLRGDRSDKSSLARGRRSSREKGNNQGVENFRFINILKLFFYIFSITLLYLFIPIRFLPTTFTHTHTHDPRPLPTTHEI